MTDLDKFSFENIAIYSTKYGTSTSPQTSPITTSLVLTTEFESTSNELTSLMFTSIKSTTELRTIKQKDTTIEEITEALTFISTKPSPTSPKTTFFTSTYPITFMESTLNINSDQTSTNHKPKITSELTDTTKVYFTSQAFSSVVDLGVKLLSSDKCWIEQDTFYFGLELPNFNIATKTSSACCSACGSNPDCKSWVFISSNESCVLKSSFRSGYIYVPGIVSGFSKQPCKNIS